jgi:hypothetical protein
VITIASKIASEHPIVGSTVVESYIEKIENSKVHQCCQPQIWRAIMVFLSPMLIYFMTPLKNSLSDDPMQLLGPEVMVAQH